MTKITTFYTPTHKIFLEDWFMKTMDEEDKKNIHIEEFEQECDSGSFMSTGWNNTMLKKVDYIRDCLLSDDMFFHLDSDIQFFKPFGEDYTKRMVDNDLDILAQHDGNNTVCCGFMLIRSTNTTKKLFDSVYERTKSGESANDQIALNELLLSGKYYLKVGLLGSECYSVWMNNPLSPRWEPHHDVGHIPKNIRIHHANYVVGIENKIKLMEMVRKKYNEMQHKENL